MVKGRKPSSSQGRAENEPDIDYDEFDELDSDEQPAKRADRSNRAPRMKSSVRRTTVDEGRGRQKTVAEQTTRSGKTNNDKKERPTIDDFRSQAVEKAVLTQSLQNPATILPFCVSVLGTIWSVAQTSELSVAVTLGFAFASASAFIYNFVVKGPDKAAKHIAQLRDLRRESEMEEYEELADELADAGFAAGAKEAGELTEVYKNLTEYLHAQKGGLSIDRFGILAEDSYRQGVKILKQALSIYKALQTIDLPKLELEVERWEREREGLPAEKKTLIKALDQQIQSHKTRIELCEKRYEKIATLLSQSNEIEFAIQSTYLELVDLGDQDASSYLSDDSGAVSRLTSAVEAARRVESKLRGQDDGEDEKRIRYLQAYDEARSQGTER